jgi:CHAT domain-containing protein/tetratricopeptide (TPR) repeat protein
MRTGLLATFAASLVLFAGMPEGFAETPADAFRRGLEDGQKLRDRLLGRKPDAARQPELEAAQADVMRLYKSGALTEALKRCEALLPAIEQAFGRKSREFSATLGIKAGIQQDLGRYEPAVEAYREAARITGEAVGQASPYYAQDLVNLADLLRVTGRLAAAEAELREAARIAASAPGGTGLGVQATALVNLGEVLRSLKRYDEAETVLNEALDIGKKLNSLELVAAAVSNRSLVQMEQGRLVLALKNLDQLPPYLKERGMDATTLGLLIQANRAGLMAALGQLDEAEALARANLALATRAFPEAAPWLAKLRAALGVILVKAGKLDEARPMLVDALSILVTPEQRIEDLVAPAVEEERFVSLYIAALARLALAAPSSAAASDLRPLLFRLVEQLSPSASARALWQMSLRAAASNPAVADIARRLQDVEGEFVASRRALFALQGPQAVAEGQRLRKSIASLLDQRAKLLAQIETRWPGYADLAGGAPATIDETQALLLPDEALVRIVALPQPMPLFADAYVWVLTKTASRLVPLSTDVKQIATDVGALRCGLDATAWRSDSSACPALTGTFYSDDDHARRKPLPFDAARAHALYTGLFGGAADLIKGKHLLIVPSGALTTLPFQVLVTEPPTSGDLMSVRWLARDRAVTVLPSVASLKALRRTAKPSAAPKPMIGFANPLLDGNQAHPIDGNHFKRRAEMARGQTGCATSSKTRTSALRLVSRSLDSGPLPSGGLADQGHLRLQSPLPETADEVCDVARSLGGSVEDMRIGARATEAEVKRLSATGELAKYRMLHFATHGTLAGQLRGTSEPGLILTPPAKTTAEDDGYLSGSEIAGLKLDAEWVILSACNTAGGAGPGEAAEALSGLARVFFYAGARALLVSHWEVDSDAAVKLVTGAIGEMTKDKSIGRGEALRRAMLATMSDTTRPQNWVPAWHPAVWAPFVVVGEGGAAR